MNCGGEISSNEACFFEQVLICETCNTLATRMLQRGMQTIDMLRTLLSMSIRQSLLNKTMQMHAKHLEEGPEVDFLGELMKMVQEVRMQEAQEQCPSNTSAPSTGTTRPSVSVAVGPPSSDSTEDSGTE